MILHCRVHCINRRKMVVVDITRFLFCCYCACESLDPALGPFCFRLEIKKLGPLLFLVLKYVRPLDQTNPFYWRHLIYIYTIYVSEKLGLGGNDVHQTVEHKYLSVTDSRMNLKHVPMMRMRNNNKTETGLYCQHQFCFGL